MKRELLTKIREAFDAGNMEEVNRLSKGITKQELISILFSFDEEPKESKVEQKSNSSQNTVIICGKEYDMDDPGDRNILNDISKLNSLGELVSNLDMYENDIGKYVTYIAAITKVIHEDAQFQRYAFRHSGEDIKDELIDYKQFSICNVIASSINAYFNYMSSKNGMPMIHDLTDEDKEGIDKYETYITKKLIDKMHHNKSETEKSDSDALLDSLDEFFNLLFESK